MAKEVVFKDKEIKKFFKRTQKTLKDIIDIDRDYAVTIAARAYKDIIDHFQDEKGPLGEWDEWSESYKDTLAGKLGFFTKGGKVIPYIPKNKKPSKHANGKKLQDSGDLRNSFKAGNWRKTSRGLEMYNNAQTKKGFPYAYAHDTGGPILPQREFMWLSDGAFEDITKVTLEYLIRK